MKKTSLAPFLICVALLLAGCARAPQTVAAPKPVAPEPAFPLPVVELTGTGQQIGGEYGQKLNEPMLELFNQYLKPYFKSDLQRFLALTAAQGFENQLSPEHRAEVEALAAAVHLDAREVMLAQCFLDLSPMTACSTITLSGQAAPDGVARFGRNLDFPARNIADKHTVVLIYHPQGRYAFAAVSWPGLIGVLTGMNEHGLTLANMEVTRTGSTPRAMPYTMLYRTVLERCKTVDEAIDLLSNTPRQTPNNLMLMDAAGNRAVVEITPAAIAVRRASDATALISTNHQRGEDGDAPGRCPRYDELHRSASTDFGRVDVAKLEGMLGRVAQGDMTLQSMVFEPSTQVMYLATGKNAPKTMFYRLDLKKFFKNSQLTSTPKNSLTNRG